MSSRDRRVFPSNCEPGRPGERAGPSGSAGLPERAPYPFRQFVVKIHSRCDLACDYCYVYTMADQRWRLRPRVMSDETIEHAALRIAEHVRTHRLPSIDVILHGGEPLLAGAGKIAHLVRGVRMAVCTAAGPGVTVRAAVQTNGIRLDSPLLDLFAELGVRVSVSLDGGPEAHDRHRRGPDGRGSYAAVSQVLRRLGAPAYRRLFNGLLCTIDLGNDPVSTYESLLAFAPPAVDFLLPHGNWSMPPPGRTADPAQTPYADWLIAVFDRWYTAPRRETRIRLFDEVIHLLLGGASRVEGIGLSPVAVVVVETDGQIETGDTLASAFSGAAVTGLDVARHPFDAALGLPTVRARQAGLAALAAACHTCPVRRICGGGLYAHRYRDGNGFDNTSVYCADLYRLIGHVKRALDRDVAALRRHAP